MQSLLEGNPGLADGKRVYKAKRHLMQSPNLLTQTKKFSPDLTPNFSQASTCESCQSAQGLELEGKESQAKTPSTVVKPVIKISGKRGQLPEGIKVLKYFKNSENTLIEKKSLTLSDSLGIVEVFSVHDEATYLHNSNILHLDHEVDDYDTTVTQLRICKEMLEQELKEAFLEIGIDNN